MTMNSSDVNAGNHGLASEYNALRKDVKNGVAETNEPSDGETIDFDLDEAKHHKVTLGGNRTLTVSNGNVDQSFTIELIQDGTGSRTVTWFGTIHWPYNVTPVLTTTPNRADRFGFICVASGHYEGYILGQALTLPS